MRKEIVVVGSINLDLVASSSHIPRAGETVAGSTFRTFSGGKGANQAVAAARLGAAVTILGKLGNDTFGVELRDSLEQAGVKTGPIRTVADSSGVALINTDAAGGVNGLCRLCTTKSGSDCTSTESPVAWKS